MLWSLKLILLSCILIQAGATSQSQTTTKSYRDFKQLVGLFPTLNAVSNDVTRGGVYMWEVLNKDEYFISRDGGTTWRWYQNGELLANLELYNVNNNGVVTLREVDGRIWIALGPTQAKWGRRPSSINNFFEYGRWTIQGNSLVDNAIRRGSDLIAPSYPPVKDRSVNRDEEIVRNGIYKWQVLNRNEYFITRDSGLTWNLYRDERMRAAYTLHSANWTVSGLLIKLKRIDAELFYNLWPMEAFWGTSANNVTNFYASGQWTLVGRNGLFELSQDVSFDNKSKTDLKNDRPFLPILNIEDSRNSEGILRLGIYKWEKLNKNEYFLTYDDGTTWSLYENQTPKAQFLIHSANWTSQGLVVQLKQMGVEIYYNLWTTSSYWGLRPDKVNVFFGNGRWTIVGNSLPELDLSDLNTDEQVVVVDKSSETRNHQPIIPIPPFRDSNYKIV